MRTFLLMLVLSASQVVLGNDVLKSKVDNLVKRLGAEKFRERKQAIKEIKTLLEKDEDVAEYLHAHRTNKDPEIRLRIQELLKNSLKILKWQDPANESKLKSASSDNSATLEIKNRFTKPIKVYWITFEGTRQRWRRVLKPGESEKCSKTFENHIWLITDEKDKALGVYVMGKENSQIVFRGVPKQKK